MGRSAAGCGRVLRVYLEALDKDLLALVTSITWNQPAFTVRATTETDVWQREGLDVGMAVGSKAGIILPQVITMAQ